MSANMNYENVLDGLDEADASEGKNDFLEPETDALLEIEKTALFPSKKDGSIIWLHECRVVDADRPEIVGKARTIMILDLKGKCNGGHYDGTY